MSRILGEKYDNLQCVMTAEKIQRGCSQVSWSPLFNLVFNVFSVLLLCCLGHSPTLFRFLIFLFLKLRVFIVVRASVVQPVIYHSPGCRLSLPSSVFCSGHFSSRSFPARSLYLEQQSLPLFLSVLLLFFMAHITIFTKWCICL